MNDAFRKIEAEMFIIETVIGNLDKAEDPEVVLSVLQNLGGSTTDRKIISEHKAAMNMLKFFE